MTPLQETWFAQLRTYRAIAVIRADHWQTGFMMAKAAITAGMKLIEITWNSHQPARTIRSLRETFPHCLIGTGTVLSTMDLRQAIAAGVQFAFSPHSESQLIEVAHAANIPMVLGAMTPSEILQAWQSGSDGVKVFPIKSVGGSQFIQCLQGPLGHIPLIPTGGVTLSNGQDFLDNGAIAVGLSSDLFPKADLQQQNWSKIVTRIQQYYPSHFCDDLSRS